MLDTSTSIGHGFIYKHGIYTLHVTLWFMIGGRCGVYIMLCTLTCINKIK